MATFANRNAVSPGSVPQRKQYLDDGRAVAVQTLCDDIVALRPSSKDIPLATAQGLFQDMTVSFAINATGNGYSRATLFHSTDGGVNFTNSGNSVMIPKLTRDGPILVTLPVPTAANNVPDLVVRIQFNGGRSNGGNVQNVTDNIRVEGTIVPEPTTIAGGLFGGLGLCWHQRRRLIRCVRLRRT